MLAHVYENETALQSRFLEVQNATLITQISASKSVCLGRQELANHTADLKSRLLSRLAMLLPAILVAPCLL